MEKNSRIFVAALIVVVLVGASLMFPPPPSERKLNNSPAPEVPVSPTLPPNYSVDIIPESHNYSLLADYDSSDNNQEFFGGAVSINNHGLPFLDGVNSFSYTEVEGDGGFSEFIVESASYANVFEESQYAYNLALQNPKVVNIERQSINFQSHQAALLQWEQIIKIDEEDVRVSALTIFVSSQTSDYIIRVATTSGNVLDNPLLEVLKSMDFKE